MYDVSEIRGHRRTYVGAMPGKFIQALKHCGTMNPVIMLDEIDKLSSSNNTTGDPESALLEVLDPSQNTEFRDHFIDYPIDLSQILFITTANYLSNISRPLYDRMEIIQVPGYVSSEKIIIAENYLLKAAIKSCGLTNAQLCISKSVISKLVEGYCREEGVRSLERTIETICRKAAYEIATGEAKDGKVDVSLSNLERYAGSPSFQDYELYKTTPPGVAIGLAYNTIGGSLIYIETAIEGSKPGLKMTGQVQQTMEESGDIAWSVAHHFLSLIEPGNLFFQTKFVHMHIPEGGIKKDGPSAGITMVSALLSRALNAPMTSGIAMTGEITLNGYVLMIGGLREKIMAAKRSGINEIIIPKDNYGDFQDLPDVVKDDVIPHFVERYEQVFKILFKNYIEGSGKDYYFSKEEKSPY